MINFIIFIFCLIILEVIALLIFGPNFFNYFFLTIFVLIITIPSLIMLLIFVVSVIQNPLFGLSFMIILYHLFKFLLSL